MVFIFAMLLIPSSFSSIPGRIVFSSTLTISNVQIQHYNDVYELSNFEFPKPEDDSGIFMTMDDSRAPGTHHAVYGALNMPYAEMMAIIMDGVSPLTEKEIISLDKDARAVQDCHQYLQNSVREVATMMPLSLSSVVESGKCSVRSIATLAFEDHVIIEGKYSYFAPGLTSSSIKINVDYAVPVEDLVLPRQSIIHTGSSATRAFVWYQGRPHLLTRCGKNKPAWFITTTIRGRMQYRSLDTAISLVNSIYGKEERLVKKSGLGVELDLRRSSKINPVADPSAHGKIFIVRLLKPTESVPGVLVDQDDCHLYDSSSAKLFNWRV